jgi:uncharacterized glyoxalase superfamily protein PhnB
MNEFSPPGWPTVIPRIAVDDPKGLVHFVKEVFNASGDLNLDRPTELKLGDSMLMIAGIESRGPFPAFLYVYVENVEDVFWRAIDLEAISIEAPCDTPYGDRRCTIEDSWGNLWQIATRAG